MKTFFWALTTRAEREFAWIFREKRSIFQSRTECREPMYVNLSTHVKWNLLFNANISSYVNKYEVKWNNCWRFSATWISLSLIHCLMTATGAYYFGFHLRVYWILLFLYLHNQLQQWMTVCICNCFTLIMICDLWETRIKFEGKAWIDIIWNWYL